MKSTRHLTWFFGFVRCVESFHLKMDRRSQLFGKRRPIVEVSPVLFHASRVSKRSCYCCSFSAARRLPPTSPRPDLRIHLNRTINTNHLYLQPFLFQSLATSMDSSMKRHHSSMKKNTVSIWIVSWNFGFIQISAVRFFLSLFSPCQCWLPILLVYEAQFSAFTQVKFVFTNQK